MAQFCDKMKSLYYEASKCPTYHKQLGVKYPELSKAPQRSSKGCAVAILAALLVNNRRRQHLI